MMEIPVIHLTQEQWDQWTVALTEAPYHEAVERIEEVLDDLEWLQKERPEMLKPLADRIKAVLDRTG